MVNLVMELSYINLRYNNMSFFHLLSGNNRPMHEMEYWVLMLGMFFWCQLSLLYLQFDFTAYFTTIEKKLNIININTLHTLPKSCFAQTGKFPLHFVSTPKLVLDSSNTHIPVLHSQHISENT